MASEVNARCRSQEMKNKLNINATQSRERFVGGESGMVATDVSESVKWSGGKNLTYPVHVAGRRTAPFQFSGSIQAYLF